MKLTRGQQSLISFLTRAVLDDDGEVDTRKVKEVYQRLKKSQIKGKDRVITAWFAKVKAKIDARTLFIDSSVELSQREIDGIRKVFEQKIGRKIVVVARVNDTILGGLKVRFGDEVWDASLASRLQQIGSVIER